MIDVYRDTGCVLRRSGVYDYVWIVCGIGSDTLCGASDVSDVGEEIRDRVKLYISTYSD